MYQVLKLFHVLAVILFLGNIITGLFWKMHADRTRDVRIMGHTMDGIIRSDRWFTIPGVLFITVFGIWGAMRIGLPILGTGWILWSLILFGASGIAFGWRVAPLQRQLLGLTRAEPFDWNHYKSKSLQWEIWGAFATITPLIAVALMVLKRPA